MRKRALVGAALAAMLVVTACGDDGDGGGEASSEYEAFCAAEVDVENAVASEDPEAIGAAFEALAAAAPEDDKATVDSVVAEAQEFLGSDSGPTPEFEAVYADLITIVKDNCGFGELDVTAKDYEFEGIDDSLDAGPNVVTLQNDGEELHEVALFRFNDGVELTVDELLALPEEEALGSVTPAGSGFAMPGATGYTVIDLTPGRYMAACFIPVGTTPDLLESGEEPQGEPHALQGMATEFEVS
jgi:hypothetical protein